MEGYRVLTEDEAIVVNALSPGSVRARAPSGWVNNSGGKYGFRTALVLHNKHGWELLVEESTSKEV